MRASLAALALFPAVALATFTINSPSGSDYWVFNHSNTISWSTSQGDPSEFNIVVVNSDNTTLNGAFAIAQGVQNNQSFTVTNVTLKTGSNYMVQFVNASNATQVLANSSSFEVKPNGTTPASVSSSQAASSTSASGSASGSSSASATGSAASSSTTSPSNGASGILTTKSAVVAAGAMALAALAI